MVATISRAEFDRELKDALHAEGIALEEFVRTGRTGEFESERLSELWIIAGPVLTADD